MIKDMNLNLINLNAPIKEALQKLNNIPDNLTLFVVDDDNKLNGSLTDGDIRRGFLAGNSIDDTVSKFMFHNCRFLQKGNFKFQEVEAIKAKKIKIIPLVDENNYIIKLIDLTKIKTVLPVDVVVMAGGRGERLKPLTDNTPKSLLTIGDKPILELNIERLMQFGIDKFHITVRYLKEQIISYFDNYNEEINISFVEENQPLGTMGSLSMIKDFEHEDVLVMNSDLLTNIDFENFYRSYIETNADMAVASTSYNVDLPYAILETKDGVIRSFKEKPTYTYYSNAGIYLIKRNLLKHIPIKQHFNATDFMQQLLGRGHKLIYYPIHGYWLDIGKHEDYAKANQDIKHIKF